MILYVIGSIINGIMESNIEQNPPEFWNSHNFTTISFQNIIIPWMEYRRSNPAFECPNSMEEDIRRMCQQLIYQNRKLGSMDAAQFPSISYNSIQKIYR